MKTITQLRDELAEAEQAQRKKSADDFVKSFKEKLEGKYFLSTWTYQGGRGASVEHYKNIRLESHSAGPDSPMVKYTRRWCCVQQPYKKEQSYSHQTGITRGTSEYETSTSLVDLTRNHQKEITKEQFHSLYEVPAALVEKQMGHYLSIGEVKVVNPTTNFDEFLAVDFPYVQLTTQESNLVAFSPFMLPASRHLITPNAKAHVMAKVRKEQATEDRCAHLYQACDMAYVREKEATLKSLIEKFK